MIPDEGKPGWARDPKSGAVLNINSSEIEAARARKIAMKKEKKRQRQVYEDVESLKQDMADIKSLLQTITEKL